MAFPFKIRFSWCCLCLVLCISGNTVTSSPFEIQRGKVDTFTNLGCQKSNNCTEKRCAEYEAKCVDDKCERCRCKEDSATFLARNSTTIITYKCVKDENIIPDSVPEQQFRLEKVDYTIKRTNQCLTVVAIKQNYKIFGKGCSSSLNMHWIWTKKIAKIAQKQTFLMNVMTLQCLEFVDCNNDTSKLALKQCKKTDRQNITVLENISVISNKCYSKNIYYLRLMEEQQNDVGYSSFGQRLKYDQWTNNKKDDTGLFNIPTSYKGCYRFQNEKFMLYLDRKTCRENPCSHQFFAPIFNENANCDVIWSESKILYGDNVQWQDINSKENSSMSISENGNHESSNIKMLKVYQNALNIFNGSLVRLAISCENKMKGNQKSVENQCLILKFKSLSSTEEEILTKTPSPALTTTLTPRSTIEKTSLTKSSINTIAIAVPVSLLAVILIVTLFYFMCYRKQKRSVPSKNTENPVTDQNSSPMVEELVESTNPPNNNSQPTLNQSQLYAKPKPRHEYQYVDAKDRTFALQPRSPKYEIPQSSTYEYPERPQSQQYEYPSLGKPILKETIQQETDTMGIYTDTVGGDSGYTSLIRRPVNNNGDNGYTHLINVQKRNEKAGARERSHKPDGLSNAMDGNVTPLKNTCEDSSNARGQKTNDEQSAKWRKDEADKSPYVVPMDSQYTALVRPPVRNGERENPGYESLIKNRK